GGRGRRSRGRGWGGPGTVGVWGAGGRNRSDGGARQWGLARARAIMFQHPVMLRRSVTANLDYALKAAGMARAGRAARCDELLAHVGLGDRRDRPARRLSGGERQRLGVPPPPPPPPPRRVPPPPPATPPPPP